MAKKPLITENDRANIAHAFGEMPDGKAESIRERASILSKREIGLSTVQRELVDLRKAHKDGKYHDELDEPWSLGSPYRVQSDHLPMIVHITQQWRHNFDKLTIRQVQWIDRLYPIPFNKEWADEAAATPYVQFQKWGTALVRVAKIYAEFERGAAIQEIKNDTSEFDDEYLEEIEKKLDRYITELKKQKGGEDNG